MPPARPTGLCECGCGGRTTVPTVSNRSLGRIAGQPMRYLVGHANRGRKRRKGPDWKREDRGYQTDCLVWQHGLSKDGYGRVDVGLRRQQYTHIVQWEAEHGPVPEGLELDHLCGQRDCGEVTHLEAVTHRENVRRGGAGASGAAIQAAKTHCPQGHPYAGDNLYVTPDGKRTCVTCRQAAKQRYRERLRARGLASK